MRGTPVTFRQLGGGINQADSVYDLQDNEARDARNVLATPRGAIRKRGGSLVLAKPASALDSLYPLVAVGPRLIGQGGAALYAIAPDGTITTITGTSGASAGKRWEFIQAPANGGQGPLYGMDGTVAAQWTGAGGMAPWTASAGNLPLGKFLVYHANKVFVAGMAAYTPSGGAALDDAKSALVWSAPGNVRDYPAANVVLFDPGDGEAISGIGTIGPYVLVFKPSKCWVVYDLDTGANRRIGNAGSVSHRSIVETPMGTLFLSRDQGVMVTDGNGVRKASINVEPLLDALAPTQRANAAGTWIDGHYYLSISTGGLVNDLTLDFQADTKAWWAHDLASQQWAVWDQGGQPKLYASRGVALSGSFAVEQAFVPGLYQDAVGIVTPGVGVNFTSYWKGPFHTFGAPFLNKRVRRVYFDGKGRISVSVSKAFSRAEELLGEANFLADDGLYGVDDGGVFGVNDGHVWGGATEVGEAKIFTPGVARAWSVIFGNTTADDFEVDSYTLAMTTRKDD